MNVERPPILALHCMLGSGRTWRRLARHLDRPLICPDLPGHGDGPLAEGDILAQAVDVALAAAPGGAFDILGHSFGGCVAMQVMADHPQRVRRAVLVEPVFFPAARPVPTQLEMTGSIIDPEHDRKKALEAFSASWGAGPLDVLKPEQQAYLLARLPLVYAANAGIVADSSNVLGRLPDLSVTLVHGGQSPPVMQRIIKGLFAAFPQVDCHEIPDAAHMLPVTHAAELARIVTDSFSIQPDQPVSA